jgi:hypothetical protein
LAFGLPIKERKLSFTVLSVPWQKPSDEAEKGNKSKEPEMLGWTILFALMSLSGVVVMLAGHPTPFCLKTVSFIFAMLFVFSLLTRAVRGRSHG